MSLLLKTEVKEIEKDVQAYYETYANEAREISEKTAMHLEKLTALIGVINAEKHSLRNEINSLCDFLSKFTDIRNNVTIFDFEVEPLYGIGQHHSIIQKAPLYDDDSKASPWEIFPLFGKRKKNQRKLIAANENLANQQIAWNNDINDRKMYCVFSEQAVKIADLYRVCITMVKDEIKKSILTELKAVHCFFFADAIRENILYNQEISAVCLNPIIAYKDTPYHKHYLFLKNTHDFYQIICLFFAKSLLSDILNDKTISESVNKKFSTNVNKIKYQIEMVNNNIVFKEKK